MVFSSSLFLYWFLPLAFAAYALATRRSKLLVLTAASYLFYGWSNPWYVPLLLFSTTVDWLAGLAIANARERAGRPAPGSPRASRRFAIDRLALLASVTSNLALLGFFKYFGFARDTWNSLATALGIEAALLDPALSVALPLGISFYTFQSMSYTIDVYRGLTRPQRSFLDFACFVSMFPQLVAGPIVRYSEIADQLEHRDHGLAKTARGVAFFALGLAKKVLLANPCGRVADAVFSVATPSPLQAWQGLLAYSFQIYFDFSGYSDMAIGLGLLFGFTFPRNFDSPYRASSITDFWRRWHISLSTWLRDYLYLPLGGNRRGVRRTYVNLFLTMLLGGLWHGAAWTFVLWGCYHGALLSVERALGPERLYGWLPKPLRIGVVFALVVVGWTLFRAADLDAAALYLRHLAGIGTAESSILDGLLREPYLLGTMSLAAVVVWFAPQTWTWTRELPVWKVASVLALLLASLALLSTQDYEPFIYFIF